MNVNIITHIENGAGLQADCLLIEALLTKWGHQCHRMQFDKGEDCARADLNIFLEVLPSVPESKLRLAPKNWMIPNPEWWYPQWTSVLPRFERILCKTRAAETIFKAMSPDNVAFTGFMSKDCRQADVVKERRFLHTAGKSQAKNTPAIMRSWLKGLHEMPLTVMWRHLPTEKIPELVNASLSKWVEADALLRAKNSCWFHLCPSSYEGWGHYYHEALSCGAIVIGASHAPMNEFHAAARVASRPMTQQRLGMLHTLDEDDLIRVVTELSKWSDAQLTEESFKARAAYETECREFHERFGKLIAEAV